jgi:beta-1,4-N-acetylglucosaminyltransferase
MRSTTKNLLFVLGSGGHTGEMLYMMEKMDFTRYGHIYIVYSKTDLISVPKLTKFLSEQSKTFNPSQMVFIGIPRTNEVGDSKLVAIRKTVLALLSTAFKLLRLKELRASYFNGPGVCIPVILVLYVRRVFSIDADARVEQAGFRRELLPSDLHFTLRQNCQVLC